MGCALAGQGLELLQFPCPQIIDPSVQVRPLSLRPGLPHDGRPSDIPQLRGDIELHHAVEAQGDVS